MRIKITTGKLVVFAMLNKSRTAKLIWDNSPITAQAERWGDEVYFCIKPKIGIEKEYARDIVEEGDPHLLRDVKDGNPLKVEKAE